MNIFVLDKDPKTAAQMMCDKHVVKMIVESCQLLSTAHHVRDGQEIIRVSKNGRKFKTFEKPNSTLLRCTMVNHPCTIWTRECAANYKWLWTHTKELLNQYTIRYGKDHTYTDLVEDHLKTVPLQLVLTETTWCTPFAQAMPDQYRDTDAVHAYRQYYIHEKSRFAKWKMNNTPDWYSQGVSSINTIQV